MSGSVYMHQVMSPVWQSHLPLTCLNHLKPVQSELQIKCIIFTIYNLYYYYIVYINWGLPGVYTWSPPFLKTCCKLAHLQFLWMPAYLIYLMMTCPEYGRYGSCCWIRSVIYRLAMKMRIVQYKGKTSQWSFYSPSCICVRNTMCRYIMFYVVYRGCRLQNGMQCDLTGILHGYMSVKSRPIQGSRGGL